MDCDSMPTLSEAHPETMDLLSRAWCNFAVNEAFQTDLENRSLVLHEYPINEPTSPNLLEMDRSVKMDDTAKTLPSWKTNDVKSWIWMQQAMHPELNYSSCFRKKWKTWQIIPFKSSQFSINKWLKEIKKKRKENERLQRAEVHAAISVAGVAAALAAIAAEKSNSTTTTTTKEAAVASAAALVAAQCAKAAEAMGAKKQHISSAMSSAMSSTTASDILTLTAAASTSLRGAATLKTRSACKNRLNTNVPVLPIEENTQTDFDFNFDKCQSILGRGTELSIKTSDGRCIMRSVSVTLNREAKVILRTRKLTLLNAFASKKESVVLEQHAELYKKSEAGDTCFVIVLTTTRGIIKLDMMDDHHCYRIWARTINHMLSLSTSFTKYALP